MKKTICIISMMILFIQGFIGNIYASDYINFENIKTDDGLSESTATSMLQDSDGYIWIGTNDGLNRYNGSEFKIYKYDKKDKNSLIDNNILTLKEDNKKRLWVGTVGGLSIIDLKNDTIKNYKYYEKSKKDLFDNVYTVLVRHDGSIIIGTYSGIYLYNEEKDDFEKILSKENGLISSEIRSIIEDKHNNLWIGTNDGLNKVDGKSEKISTFKYEESDIKNILSLVYDKNDNLWIGTKDGLYKINVLTKDVSREKISDNENDEGCSVRAILQDNYGSIWIGTSVGLSKYIGKGKFITYESKKYDINSLASNIIYSLMQDKDGLIWVGTYTGVSRFDSQNNILLYKNDVLDENSISDDVIHGIYEDKDGILWIGTSDGALNKFDRKNNKFTHIVKGTNDNNLNSNYVKVITGNDDTVFVGTSEGLNIIDKKTMKVKIIGLDDGLSDKNIKCLYLKDDYLWIGTSKGLDILNTKNNKITNLTYILKKSGTKELNIEDIYEDKDGIFWIGDFVSGGLIKLDIKNKKIKIFNMSYNNENKDNPNKLRCIAEDKHNTLWIGTMNGLYKFDKKTEKIKYYSEEDGLSNNSIYGILFDKDYNLWISTNNGISILDVKTNKFTTITSTDGLQGNEFNGKSFCKLSTGEMAFGGTNGLNIFYPDKINLDFKSPKVVFDSFEVQGKTYKNINNMKFNYNENFMRIKFFIPEYKKNNNIQYYYKLEGLNQDWIKIKNNEIIFNNLKPGHYTFKIKVKSQNGSFGEVNSVSFNIKPHFLLTPIAFFVYVILILLIIYNQYNKVKRLDRLVAKRTKDLNEEMKKNKILYDELIRNERSKNNYFINLSHELRTPLNVICSLEQLITNLNKSKDGLSKDKIDYYMDVMRNNTRRLLNLINNIIDCSKIENGKYKINKSENDIVYLVEETALSLKDSIESTGIELIIDTDIEEKTVNCDSYEIERCIVNLISNAAKFTPEGGRITVEIKDNDDSIIISVEDTGVGIDKEYHDLIFDRFNQVVDDNREVKGGSGLGLTITKQIINLHNGTISVTSEKNKGSKFTILLPVA